MWSGRGMRSMSTLFPRLGLNQLDKVPGSTFQRKRVGRGVGSGWGKTCGKGQKGQKTRSGASRTLGLGFEGGQNPYHKKFPKWGFKSLNKKKPAVLNLGTIADWVEKNKLDVSKPLTLKDLYDSNVAGRFEHGVKLLARGSDDFNLPIKICASDCSPLARQLVERAGGQVEVVYYGSRALRAHLRPHMFERIPKSSAPPQKWLLRHRPDLATQRNYALTEKARKKAGV